MVDRMGLPAIARGIVSALALALLLPAGAWAHPGNVDANGCHTNHRTGEYHCHPERAQQHNSPGPGAGGYRRPGSNRGGGGYRRPSTIVQTGGPTGATAAATGAQVSDGDTFKATIDGGAVTVRLYGIDAPEGKQPGGNASAAALRSLLAGQRLAVVPYGKDKFGRILGVVYATNLGKTTVNQAMLEGGHAWHFGQYCTEGFCPSWKQSEMNARQARRGIWASQNQIPPWDWRAAHGR